MSQLVLQRMTHLPGNWGFSSCLILLIVTASSKVAVIICNNQKIIGIVNMELTKYSWWGKPNEPPLHLKTKKQLAELSLAPLKLVGVIETQKYNVLLYDPLQTAPLRK